MIIEFWKTGENPITCYNSRPNKESIVKVPKQLKKQTTQPVLVEFADGKNQEYETVVEAAAALKIESSKLYNILNGKGKPSLKYSVYKIGKSNN